MRMFVDLYTMVDMFGNALMHAAVSITAPSSLAHEGSERRLPRASAPETKEVPNDAFMHLCLLRVVDDDVVLA